MAESVYFDPFDAGIDRNVHDVWARLREEQPAYWNERYGFSSVPIHWAEAAAGAERTPAGKI